MGNEATATLVRREQQAAEMAPPQPADLVRLALERGSDPGTLERLMALQERWEATQARRAFTEAMAAFKRVCLSVLPKDGHVKHSGADYRHATLGGIVSAITGALSEAGLSVGWETEQGERGAVRVTCRVTHVAGHSTAVSLTAPPDDSGRKNQIQQIGSTVTYLQRYTLTSALGLATAEDDDDGQAAGPRPEERRPAQQPVGRQHERQHEHAGQPGQRGGEDHRWSPAFGCGCGLSRRSASVAPRSAP
jgi:hypothetical protein